MDIHKLQIAEETLQRYHASIECFFVSEVENVKSLYSDIHHMKANAWDYEEEEIRLFEGKYMTCILK